PGQERFDFMWEILGEGMLGYILLIDATREDSLEQAVGILAAFRKMARVPFVVALNHADGLEPLEEERVRSVLELAEDTPVVPCDATDRESVKSVLLALLYCVVDQIDGLPLLGPDRVAVPAPAAGEACTWCRGASGSAGRYGCRGRSAASHPAERPAAG
ncbi:MAG: ATP/GTP-binding protein, partial [Actinomycetota bacterium]|nr:ATP/GTP-binding protein [Actinomycetota bacterium]